MTVKEGEGDPKYTGPYQMSKLSPVLGPNYYEHLIHDKSNNNYTQAWDLFFGVQDLAAKIMEIDRLKKELAQQELDKKNGIEVKVYDTKDLYHMQIDA